MLVGVAQKVCQCKHWQLEYQFAAKRKRAVSPDHQVEGAARRILPLGASRKRDSASYPAIAYDAQYPLRSGLLWHTWCETTSNSNQKNELAKRSARAYADYHCHDQKGRQNSEESAFGFRTQCNRMTATQCFAAWRDLGQIRSAQKTPKQPHGRSADTEH